MNPLPHLICADTVWRHLELLPATRGHFLLGAVAPDAHRVDAGIGYRRLHFRSRSRPGERLQDFLYDYVQPALNTGTAEEQGFRLGWTCHIVADALWRRMLRAERPELWRGGLDGTSPEGRHLRVQYQWACDAADHKLTEPYPHYVAELRQLLRSTDPHYDVKPLGPAALSHWVGRVTTGAMPPPAPPGPGYEAVDHDFVLRAMDAAREEALAVINAELRRLALYNRGG